MKVAYFLDVPQGLGGAGNLLLQQAILMSEIYDVTVIIPTDDNGVPNEEYASRCELHNIRYRGIRYQTSYNFSMIDFMEAMNSVTDIEEFTKRERIDFFHSVQLNLAVEYVSRKLKIPHLMNIYQLPEEEFRICQSDIYPHYHLCDSILYSERWKRQLKIESRCLRPVALQDSIIFKRTYSAKKLLILMLGAVCVRKNQMAAIKAVESFVRSGKAELHIAGEAIDGHAEECIAYVKDQELEKSIIFHGFVSDIVPLLQSSDCLLCTSTDESFPSSMVEAMTYDLTIISTPVAGVPELFVNKVNSFISEDFSERSINKSIQECFEYYSNGKIYEIHTNAEKTWQENFARGFMRKELNSYYKEIIADKRYGELNEYVEIIDNIRSTQALLQNKNNTEILHWVCRKDFYYNAIQQGLSGAKMYIWGAGKRGRIAQKILNLLCPSLEIAAFIDQSKEGCVDNIAIKKPEAISFEKDCFYCISPKDGKYEILQYLKDMGLELHRQVWFIPF